MGKLLDLLEQSSRGAAQPLGFAISKDRRKVPPVLLIGSVKLGDNATAEKLSKAGLAIAVLTMETQVKGNEVERACKALNDVVTGVWHDVADAVLTKDADYEVFTSEETPIGSLDGEDRTLVMQIDPDLDDSLLRTIEDLPVDAFLVSVADAPTLTLRQLMRIARVRGLTSKYLLVQLAKLPSKEEMAQFRDAGVNALIVDVAAHSVEDIKTCKAALDELPQMTPQRKNERPVPTLPPIRTAAASVRHEEDDDDGDYDDDEG